MHVVADPRLVRRVIKRQRGLSGFGLQVPHGHCCVIDRAPLLALVSENELGKNASDLPATVILVARPEREDVHDVWRRAFHGYVHHHLEDRARNGTLTNALVRERINRIGQTEFDEIRAVLRSEELLFSVRDDREAYIEFAAFYLELTHFEPDALDEFFPGIRDTRPIEEALALDVDASLLLGRCKPSGRGDLAPRRATPPSSMPAPLDDPRSGRRPAVDSVASVAPDAVVRAASDAGVAKKKGNLARSIVVRMAAGQSADDDIDALAARLSAATAGPSGLAPEAWRDVIVPLAEAAVRADSRRALEGRALHDLQKACVDAERGRHAVDVVTWLTSLFRRPIVRPLPAVRVVRVARHLRHAFEKSLRASLSKADRGKVEDVFRRALAAANENARRAVKPALEGVLDDVGLGPKSVPERVAREKLSEEIVDLVLERGSLGLSQLRDALSRSNIKMANLAPVELVKGDPILRADALLSERLDGVYRGGEIYLRGLQKISSVAFGTRAGRLLTLHVVLPLLLSFVLLEGLQHVAHPIAKALGHRHFHLLTLPSFVTLALLFYGLIHSDGVRRVSRAVLGAVGSALHAVFWRIPASVLSSVMVRAFVRSRLFSLTVKPLLVGGLTYLVARRAGLDQSEALSVVGILVVLTALFLSTSVGFLLEEAIAEVVLRRLRQLSRRVLPGLLAFVVDLFRVFVERVERGIYTVDEWLTFKEGEGTASLVAKGILGTIWFFATYLLRIYVNVLIEPQVNPIKHFPVVTVSHKIILPMSPTILGAMRGPLAPLGAVASNTIAGSTVFLLPGAFGFLVWELKANWNLYDQNRSPRLEPVRIGHHGETMSGLLVVGFHSGTVPKLFSKLRRAVKKGEAKMNAYRQKLHDVEHAVTTFIERELVGLLHQASRWRAGELAVHSVEVGSNRIRIGIACPQVSPDVAWLQFEEQSGMLLASVPVPGFIDALAEGPRATLETALAGLYKRAGVDIVREQVAALLGRGVPYDVADEGLVVWPGEGYETEVVYDLTASGPLAGVVRGAALKSAPATLESARLVFGKQEIAWTTWVEAFSEQGAARVIDGPPLLP